MRRGKELKMETLVPGPTWLTIVLNLKLRAQIPTQYKVWRVKKREFRNQPQAFTYRSPMPVHMWKHHLYTHTHTLQISEYHVDCTIKAYCLLDMVLYQQIKYQVTLLKSGLETLEYISIHFHLYFQPMHHKSEYLHLKLLISHQQIQF